MSRNCPALAPLLFALLLSACSTAPLAPVGVAGGSTWSMQGKLAVSAERQQRSFTIDWSQLGEQFEISLYGPLGLTAARMVGTADGVSLQVPGEPVLVADDADALMAEALGMEIPVTPMRYWVRGEPAPGPHRRAPDSIIQFGWTIEYLRFADNLPVRVRLSRPEVSLNLAVRQWSN